MWHCKSQPGNVVELCSSKRMSGKHHISGAFKEACCTRWNGHSSFTTLEGHIACFFLQGKLHCDTVRHEKNPTIPSFSPPTPVCPSARRENLHLFQVTELIESSTSGSCVCSEQHTETSLKPPLREHPALKPVKCDGRCPEMPHLHSMVMLSQRRHHHH